MFYLQSHGPWWSAEFQARAIEGRRAVARSDNKLTWLDVQKALGREFPEEVEKHGLPSEQQVRNWAVGFEALTSWLVFCIVLGMWAAMARLVISSL